MNSNRLNAAIATKIREMVAKGIDPVEALKAVCGGVVVDKMISDLYDELRTTISDEEFNNPKPEHFRSAR